MALVLADVGADVILKAFFNNSWAAGGKNLTLKLFTNNITPADTDTASTYIEATGGGYAAITLTNGSWTVTVGNDPSDAVYTTQTFSFTGTIGGSGIVYGYFIVDADGVLVHAEKFSSAFTPLSLPTETKVIPKFQMSKGTPT